MKKLPVILVLLFTLTVGLCANGLNLNGNGTKAIAMGGAFIGLADDYSAVFWNPAGLTQMKKTNVAVFLTDVIPTATYSLSAFGIDATSEPKHYLSGGFGFFKPISDKVTVGMYAYVPSGSGVKWDGSDLAMLSGGVAYEWESLIAHLTLSPAVAFKVSEKLSIGATLNINYGIIKLKRATVLSPTLVTQYEEDLNGMAVGATIGMLYKPTEKFSFGLTYKTPITIKVSGDVEMPGAAYLGLPPSDEGERETTWPMWIGAGICIKPSDTLTFTADAQYTNWKKMTVIPMSFYNQYWETYFAENAGFELKWKDTVQLRFGVEYKVSEAFALRAGYYYDPNPSPTSTLTIVLPEITYNFITFGFGYKTGKINLDAGFEIAWGKERDLSFAEADPKAGMPGLHNNNIIVPNIALTIYL
ncbi:MAG: hypothetical protein GY757_39915 [bacterium]|nr:hypothetical protein [bacterium]